MDDRLPSERPDAAVRPRWIVAVLSALLWVLPSITHAAPTKLTLTQYQGRLATVVQHVETAVALTTPAPRAEEAVRAARDLTTGEFVVQVPGGELQADLQQIGARLAIGDRAKNQEALAVAKEHLRAAERLAQPTVRDLATARQELANILSAQETERAWNQRLGDWIGRLLTPVAKGGVRVFASPLTKWVGAVIGLGGVGLVVRGLLRTLGGAGGGSDAQAAHLAALKQRLLTPDDLWRQAQTLSAQGDHEGALRMGYLALLKHFDRLALLRYVPALTDREHERQLRGNSPALAGELSPLTHLVERLIYGGEGVTAADFARGADLIERLWREGDAASRPSRAATAGA